MTTFVLIHGSYQGGWIWQRVASRLRAAGHAVYAPTLDGCAERKRQVRPGITIETHAVEIAELLFYEDLRDVVMVGTSSGGMVLCRAAEAARDRIGRLVLVDALALFEIGYSWGGVTSLAVAYNFGHLPGRPPYDHRIVRLNIGLESTADLVADLDQALCKISS